MLSININNIIKKYLLPNKINIKNNKTNCINEVINKTDLVYYKLKYYTIPYIENTKYNKSNFGHWNLILKNNYI